MLSSKLVAEVIASLLVILWVYAAMSKLLDYQTFYIQLAKSPLISEFAAAVALTVPLAELTVAILLAIPKLKLWGLYASLFLLILFSAYLIALLNFSQYIPCACGGVFSDLSWEEHIIANLVLAALAVSGVILAHGTEKESVQPGVDRAGYITEGRKL